MTTNEEQMKARSKTAIENYRMLLAHYLQKFASLRVPDDRSISDEQIKSLLESGNILTLEALVQLYIDRCEEFHDERQEEIRQNEEIHQTVEALKDINSWSDEVQGLLDEPIDEEALSALENKISEFALSDEDKVTATEFINRIDEEIRKKEENDNSQIAIAVGNRNYYFSKLKELAPDGELASNADYQALLADLRSLKHHDATYIDDFAEEAKISDDEKTKMLSYLQLIHESDMIASFLTYGSKTEKDIALALLKKEQHTKITDEMRAHVTNDENALTSPVEKIDVTSDESLDMMKTVFAEDLLSKTIQIAKSLGVENETGFAQHMMHLLQQKYNQNDDSEIKVVEFEGKEYDLSSLDKNLVPSVKSSMTHLIIMDYLDRKEPIKLTNEDDLTSEEKKELLDNLLDNPKRVNEVDARFKYWLGEFISAEDLLLEGYVQADELLKNSLNEAQNVSLEERVSPAPEKQQDEAQNVSSEPAPSVETEASSEQEERQVEPEKQQVKQEEKQAEPKEQVEPGFTDDVLKGIKSDAQALIDYQMLRALDEFSVPHNQFDYSGLQEWMEIAYRAGEKGDVVDFSSHVLEPTIKKKLAGDIKLDVASRKSLRPARQATALLEATREYENLQDMGGKIAMLEVEVNRLKRETASKDKEKILKQKEAELKKQRLLDARIKSRLAKYFGLKETDLNDDNKVKEALKAKHDALYAGLNKDDVIKAHEEVELQMLGVSRSNDTKKRPVTGNELDYILSNASKTQDKCLEELLKYKFKYTDDEGKEHPFNAENYRSMLEKDDFNPQTFLNDLDPAQNGHIRALDLLYTAARMQKILNCANRVREYDMALNTDEASRTAEQKALLNHEKDVFEDKVYLTPCTHEVYDEYKYLFEKPRSREPLSVKLEKADVRVRAIRAIKDACYKTISNLTQNAVVEAVIQDALRTGKLSSPTKKEDGTFDYTGVQDFAKKFLKVEEVEESDAPLVVDNLVKAIEMERAERGAALLQEKLELEKRKSTTDKPLSEAEEQRLKEITESTKGFESYFMGDQLAKDYDKYVNSDDPRDLYTEGVNTYHLVRRMNRDGLDIQNGANKRYASEIEKNKAKLNEKKFGAGQDISFDIPWDEYVAQRDLDSFRDDEKLDWEKIREESIWKVLGQTNGESCADMALSLCLNLAMDLPLKLVTEIMKEIKANEKRNKDTAKQNRLSAIADSMKDKGISHAKVNTEVARRAMRWLSSEPKWYQDAKKDPNLFKSLTKEQRAHFAAIELFKKLPKTNEGEIDWEAARRDTKLMQGLKKAYSTFVHTDACKKYLNAVYSCLPLEEELETMSATLAAMDIPLTGNKGLIAGSDVNVPNKAGNDNDNQPTMTQENCFKMLVEKTEKWLADASVLEGKDPAHFTAEELALKRKLDFYNSLPKTQAGTVKYSMLTDEDKAFYDALPRKEADKKGFASLDFKNFTKEQREKYATLPQTKEGLDYSSFTDRDRAQFEEYLRIYAHSEPFKSELEASLGKELVAKDLEHVAIQSIKYIRSGEYQQDMNTRLKEEYDVRRSKEAKDTPETENILGDITSGNGQGTGDDKKTDDGKKPGDGENTDQGTGNNQTPVPPSQPRQPVGKDGQTPKPGKDGQTPVPPSQPGSGVDNPVPQPRKEVNRDGQGPDKKPKPVPQPTPRVHEDGCLIIGGKELQASAKTAKYKIMKNLVEGNAVSPKEIQENMGDILDDIGIKGQISPEAYQEDQGVIASILISDQTVKKGITPLDTIGVKDPSQDDDKLSRRLHHALPELYLIGTPQDFVLDAKTQKSFDKAQKKASKEGASAEEKLAFLEFRLRIAVAVREQEKKKQALAEKEQKNNANRQALDKLREQIGVISERSIILSSTNKEAAETDVNRIVETERRRKDQDAARAEATATAKADAAANAARLNAMNGRNGS